MPTSAIDGNFDDKSAAAIQAAREGVAVCDRSHWGRIQVSEGDRIRFLHNQSTNDFQRLKPGQGCDTVFVTSTARTIDLATSKNWLYKLHFGSKRYATHPSGTSP